jgi:hypothetical protein
LSMSVQRFCDQEWTRTSYIKRIVSCRLQNKVPTGFLLPIGYQVPPGRQRAGKDHHLCFSSS